MGRFEISPKRRAVVVFWSFFVGLCLFPGTVKLSWGVTSVLKELKEQLVETKKEISGLEKTLGDVRIQIVKRNVPSVRNQHLNDPICDSACQPASTMCGPTVLRALGMPVPEPQSETELGTDSASEHVRHHHESSVDRSDYESLEEPDERTPLLGAKHPHHRHDHQLKTHPVASSSQSKSGEGQCIALFKKAGSDIYALGRINAECAEQVQACPWVKDQIELAEMQTRVVSLEAEIKDKKEELKTLRKDMMEATEGCVDCGAGSAGGSMSQREPTTAELVLWGLGNIGVPLAQTGLGFAANIEAMKYSNNAYGQYVDQCRKAGVPCSPPGAFFAGGGGAGGAYSGGFPIAGGFGGFGPSFNGGSGAFLPPGAFGGGAYPIAGGSGYPGSYTGGYPGQGALFGNASINLPTIGFPGANIYAGNGYPGGGYSGGYPGSGYLYGGGGYPGSYTGGYPGNGGFFGNASLNLPTIGFPGANIYAGSGFPGGSYPGGAAGYYPGGSGYTGGGSYPGGGVYSGAAPFFNANGSVSMPGLNSWGGGIGTQGGLYANGGIGANGAGINAGWNIPTHGGLYVTGAGGANVSPPYLAPGYGNPQYQAMYGASAQNSMNSAYEAQRAQDVALAQRQFYEAQQNYLRVQQTSYGYGGNFQAGASLRMPTVNAGFQFGPWGIAGALN